MSVLSIPYQPNRKGARLLLMVFVCIILAELLSPASKLLVVLAPTLSFAIALYLHRQHRGYYVGLVCWLFFLTPLLRRLIEFRTGDTTASFVMICPFLACVAGLAIFRDDWSQLFMPVLRNLLYVAAAIAYGTIVGFLSNPKVAVVQDIFGWISPICFALYVFAQREHLSELLDAFRTSFIYGALIMGLYGICQFFFVPPWDAFWMENSALTSIGFPEPMEVRVFSTMNTPQPFADYLLCGVMLSITSTRRIRFLSMPIALLVLGLTMSRSAWGGGVVGMILLSISLTARQRMRIVSLLVLCGVLLGAAVQVPQINEILTRRLQTFSNIQQDGSFNDRVQNQQQAIAAFQSSPFGLGLGADGRSKNQGPSYGVPPQSLTIGDNGIEEVLLSFGWCGSIVFLIGFGGALLACLRTSRNAELMAVKAVLVALVSQIPLMGIFPGASGFLVWSSIAICLSWEYCHSQERLLPSSRLKAFRPGFVREAR
jgi:O-antigen ligase